MKSSLIENRQIRIFISSTFMDMQMERDYLVQNVFPSLRRYCDERDVTIQELDLRWGITEEESKQGKVVDICLKEIKKTTPFFIGLLGERYGWVPNEEDRGKIANSTKVFQEYSWVKGELENGTSITEIEIQEGVLRAEKAGKKINAYFYFRSETPNMEVPEDFKEKPGSQEAKKLQRLKQTLREQKNYPVMEYDSVEHLGNLVEHDFKVLVENLFPQGTPLSELEKERLKQRVLLKRMTDVYIPIPTYESCIDDFVQDAGRSFVICGESGMGKSALIAHWVQNRKKQENEKVIYHFIDQSMDEGDYRKITGRLIEEIKNLYVLPPLPLSKQSKGEDKQKIDWENLLFAVQNQGRLVIILDGVDKLSETDAAAKLLMWLPSSPDTVKFIFSTHTKDMTMDYFKRMEYPIIEVEPLDLERRKTLIVDYLASFGKKLKPTEIERIAHSKGSNNPLALCTILDELRVFGMHEELNIEISRYLRDGGSMLNLFTQVIERREKTFNYDEKNFVCEVFSLLYVSRNGISEDEISKLTGAAPLRRSQLLNGTASHLITRGGLVSFAHSFIRNAVKNKYLLDDATVRKYRRKIVDCMSNPSVSMSRRLDELPYQLFELGDWDALYHILLDFNVFEYLFKKNGYEIGKYWQTLFDKDKKKYSIEKYLELDTQGRTTAEMAALFDYLSALTSEMLPDRSIAVSFSKRAITIKEGIYGVNHIETARSYTAIGVAYSGSGTGKEQLDYHLKALAIYKSSYGEEHPVTADAYFYAGTSYNSFEANNFSPQKAIDFLLQAIAIQEKVLHPDHPDTAMSYVGLAGIYQVKLEDNEMALKYLLKALMAMEKTRGKNHPQTASIYSYLSSAYSLLGAYEKADDYANLSLSILRSVYGENAFPTLNNGYASFKMIYMLKLFRSKPSPKKQEIFEKFLKCMLAETAILSKIYGECNEQVAEDFDSIGNGYACIGDDQNALVYYKKSHAIYRALFGEDDSRTEDIRGAIESAQEAIEREKVLSSLDYSNEDACVEYVEEDGAILKFVPLERRTETVCLAAIQEDCFTLEYVPLEIKMKMPDICMTAVRGNWMNLEDVPAALRTNAICLEAIRQDGLALEYVPQELRTTAFCLEAVRHDSFEARWSCMSYVPEHIQTEGFCLAAIEANPMVIKYFSPNLRTERVCRTAIEANGAWGLMYTPPEVKTPELCLTAVKQNGDALMLVPGKYLTRELCLAALSNTNNKDVIKCIPYEILKELRFGSS